MRTVLFLIFALTFICSASAQHTQTPEANEFFTALTLYEAGQFEEAVIAFEKFIGQSSDAVQRKKAFYYLALSQSEMDPDNTIAYFDRFTAEYPSSDEAAKLYIDLAHRFSYEGDLPMANMLYEKALQLRLNEVTEANVYYWNAETYLSRRMYAKAHEYYYKVSTLHPRSEWAPVALYNQGRVYLIQRDYENASKAFDNLRRRYPGSPITRRIGTALGEAYYNQGRYTDAIESLRSVLASLDREQEVKAVLIIAESYNYLNELGEASTWYRRYINLTEGKPEERLAHYGLGWVFHKQGVYHWAADSFAKVVTGEDELSRRALYYQAVNHKLSGRYDQALVAFNKFGNRFRSGPWVEQAYYEWAILAFEIGDYVTAIEKNLHLIRSGMELENPGAIFTLLGESYFANSEYGRAIEAFERAERAGNVDEYAKLQARFQRGWVMYRNHAFEEAQRIFEQVYRDDPTGPLAGEALFWSADSYYNLGEYGPASARFQRFISEFRNHEFIGAARYSLGWSYFKMGQFENAIPPLRAFLSEYKAPPIALFPYDVDTRLRLGDALYALRRYDEAIPYYEAVLNEPRGADYAKYQVANSFYRKDMTFESVRTFRQLIVEFPNSTLREQAQYNIGYIYLLSGNYAQAISEFELLLRLFPFSQWAARAQYNIGNAHYNAGNNAQAIEAYKLVLERYPRSDLIIEAVNGIQFAQEAGGMTDTSNEILEDFISKNPQAGLADRLRFRQAERMLQTGDYDGAIAAFRQYIRVSNNQRLIADAWFNLGNAYESIGDHSQAQEAYQTILTDFPRSERYDFALMNLGKMHLDRGNFQEAYNRYDQLAKRGARFLAEANIGMGNASLGMRNYEQARRHFDKAREAGGDPDVALLGQGKVFLGMNQYESARDALRQVADRNNREPGAEAQYLIGQTYQSQGNHNAAIQAFSNVRIFFGAYGDWVSRSLLGSLRSNLSLGNRIEAENILRMLRDQYPGTEALSEAERLFGS